MPPGPGRFALLLLGLGAWSGCWLSLDFSGFEPGDAGADASAATGDLAGDDLSAAPDAAACVPDTRAHYTWSVEAGPVPDVFQPGRGIFQSATATLPGGRMFMLGGYDGGQDALSMIWELHRNYDFMGQAVTWTTFGALPSPTFGAAALALPDGNGLLVGGQLPGSVTFCLDGGVVTTSGDQPFATANRGLGAALGPDGLPWTAGGFNDGPSVERRDVTRRSPDGGWQVSGSGFPPELLIARYGAGVVQYRGQLLAIGGLSRDLDAGVQIVTASAEALPAPGFAWQPFPTLPSNPGPGYVDAVVGADGSLYAIVVGELNAPSEPAIRAYRYDACAGQWSFGMDLGDTPQGKAAVGQGLDGRIYVLGGGDRGVRAYGPRVLTELVGDTWYLWGTGFISMSNVTLYDAPPPSGAVLGTVAAGIQGELPARAFTVTISTLPAAVREVWVMDDLGQYPLRVPVPGR